MTTNQTEYHYLFKVVLVGNSCVGKSSIVVRYADDEFSEVFLATIGVDFRFKSFSLQGNKIKLQIWDTAGHERFRTITSSYYRGAHALMIVFDITDKGSFDDAINYWFNEIKNSCPVNTQTLLVGKLFLLYVKGNKRDLEDKRAVFSQDIDKVLQAYPDIQYIETSAKTAEHIQQAFHKIAGMLVAQQVKKNQPKDKKKKHSSKDKEKRATSSTIQTTTNEQSQQQKSQTTKLENKKKQPSYYKQYCCSN